MRRLNLILIAAVLLLAGLGVWLLRAGEHDVETSAAILGRAAPAADAPSFVEASRGSAAVTPDALPAAVEPVADGAPASAAATPPAAVAAEDDSVEAVFRGRVVDDLGTPIAGATVVYWPNQATLPLYGLKRDPFGAALDLLPRVFTGGNGRFELRARHRNGTTLGQAYDEDPMLVVLSGEFATRSELCRAFTGGEHDAGDIALEPGARLTGRIVDEAGHPIEGATFRPRNPAAKPLRGVADPDKDWTFPDASAPFGVATSGPDGRFLTGPMWNGSVGFSVEASGFLGEWSGNTKVTVGGPNDLGDIVLRRGTGLAGTVRDALGAPVADARVVCWEADAFEAQRSGAAGSDTVMQRLHAGSDTSARTDAAGRYYVPNLNAVNHSLCVDAPGFEPLVVEDLLPGGAEPALALVRAAALHLTVIDAATREPVSAALVSARRFSGESRDVKGRELPVNAGDGAGRFVVERLGLVRTTVTVSAPGFATTDLALDGVVPPAAVERTLELLREATLTGRVTAEDGKLLAGASVVAQLGTDAAVRLERQTTATDAQGRFSFVGLAGGDWALSADARDFAFVERAVTLAAGQQLADVDFVLPPAASVFGVCSREDGSPDAGHVLPFRWVDPASAGADAKDDRRETQEMHDAREARQSPAAKCDAQGRYEIRDLQPGAWKVYGRPSAEITLAPGERRELNLREGPAARIAGRLLLADGTPAHDGWVMGHMLMLPQNLTLPAHAHVGEDGRYEIRNRPGRFTLIGAVPGPDGGLSPPVTLTLHENEQHVQDLQLGDLSLRGRVVESVGGASVPGARVYALLKLEGEEFLGTSSIGSGNRSWFFGSTSDAEGRFELVHLAPGLYTLGVDAPGASAEEHAPVLLVAGAAPGTSPEVELRVLRTGSVTGVARNAAGVPVKSYTYVSADGPGKRHEVAETVEGRFEFKGLVAGIWQLSISKDDTVIASQGVTVTAGQASEIVLIVP